MTLEVPELDDRTFEELVADLRHRIPVHSEAWTDHNAHDPGIAILEVLAYVAESDVYRLDRVTDAHVEKYLELLGVEPEPPVAAAARLGLDPPPALAGETIPAGERLEADDGDGSVETFETTAGVTLTRANVAGVVTDHAGGRADNTRANDDDGLYFLAFGERPRDGDAVYVGFDADPFADAEEFALHVDFHGANLPEPAEHGGEEPTFEPSVSLEWQYCTDYGAWYDPDAWASLRVADGTDHLYHGGTITVEEPDGWTGEEGTVFEGERELRWIRCVVRRGGYEVPPQVATLRTNVVPASHGTERRGESLTRENGGTETTARPNQAFSFERAPVLSASIEVGGEPWKAVADFDASRPDDEHYVLDHAAGTVRFGDEVHGKVPEPGQEVVAERYVHGGGQAGNVPPSTWTFADDRLAGVDVAPERRPSGGRGAESLDAALGRLRADRRRPYRGVTAEDYRYLATHTPGLRFGRARATVEDVPAEGCPDGQRVRVVVVPFGTGARPVPSDGFLDAVRCHLARHRLLTDEVSVEGPRYVGVSVSADVSLEEGYAAGERLDAVGTALDEFLDPLSGFEGEGWPFGRPLYRSEVYETVEGVAGVDCAFDVSTTARGDYEREGGTILVDDDTLLYPAGHDLSVRGDREDCRRPGR